jgi:inorganic pyrophosphatase
LDGKTISDEQNDTSPHAAKGRQVSKRCHRELSNTSVMEVGASQLLDIGAGVESHDPEMYVRKPIEISGFEPTKLKVTPHKGDEPGEDKDALNVRYFFDYESKRISPWHDIPYAAKKEGDVTLLHFVCEIPKGTAKKFEIVTKNGVDGDPGPFENNPIMQDRKKDKKSGEFYLREYKYPEENPGTMVNYGAVPQTWEDPDHVTPETDAKGDDDPIDVVQLNDASCQTGDVQVVRPLGIFALIDDGETDWKMLVVDVNAKDAASKWKSLKDVPKETQTALIKWFKEYKIPEGKGENEIAMKEEIQDEVFAAKVAQETHKAWCKLAKVDDGYCNKVAVGSNAANFSVWSLLILTLVVSAS